MRSGTWHGEYEKGGEGVNRDYDSQQVTSDIGLVRLSSAAPAGVAPLPALPESSGLTPADEGSPVVFSGFGVTEHNTSGEKLTVTATV